MRAVRIALDCMCQHIDAQAEVLGVKKPEKSQDVLTAPSEP